LAEDIWRFSQSHEVWTFKEKILMPQASKRPSTHPEFIPAWAGWGTSLFTPRSASLSPAGGSSFLARALNLIGLLALIIYASECSISSAQSVEAGVVPAASKLATTTVLTASSAGVPVTTVPSGTLVTLTASVKAGSAIQKAGQVIFCDASAAHCTDIHILGMAQITKAGTATLKLRPAIGNHSYKAQFLGTTNNAASYSAASPLSVTGKTPSTTALFQAGLVGNYTLTATVSSSAKTAPGPGGKVSFVDTTNGNSVLATAALGAPVVGPGLVNISNPKVGSMPGAMVVADFNGDGNPDLAIATSDASQSVGILLGDGTGKFTRVTKSPITATGFPVLTQDFNGDGIPDLLLTVRTNGPITILLGNGDGTFRVAPGSPFSTNYGEYPVVSADFNGDGIPDLACDGGYYLTIQLGNGDGTFTQKPIDSTLHGSGTGMVVGDLNRDGIADLVFFNGQTYLGNGDGTFKPGTPIPVSSPGGGTPTALALGDFNRDGILDLAVLFGGSNGSITILLGKGDGTFQPAAGGAIAVEAWSDRVSVGDFNGDGIADLWVAANSNQTSLNILLGKGDGTFTQSPVAAAAVLECCIDAVLGDFNGDGITDMASADSYNGAVNVLAQQFIQSTTPVTAVTPKGPGTHLVAATYPGDTKFATGTSPAATLIVPLAPPVSSPPPGDYTSIQSVTLTDATPGTTIQYLLNGASATYTGPIKLSAAGVNNIQAWASKTGFQDSPIISVNYTLNLPPAATPRISLASGAYPGPQTVTLSDATPGTKIYYTTNGSWPSAYSPQYTGPITVSSTQTLAAAAIAYGYSMSANATAQYIIGHSATRLIYTIAGSGTFGYSGDGGPATIADLNYPNGAVMDGAGNLYIADTGNSLIRKVAAGTGIISTFAGNGIAGFTGDKGPATSAELYQPLGLAIDSAGNLYISDSFESVVRKVTASTGIITTVAGNGKSGYSGDGGPATAASLSSPIGIALDSKGNLYIADSSANRIRKVTATTGTITTVAGNGQAGFAGDGGPATSAQLNYPGEIAVDSIGNLYVADTNNYVIREVAAGTGVISTVAGVSGYPWGRNNYTGDGGPAIKATMNAPRGVAVDAARNIYIADTNNNVIRMVAASTGIITTVVGYGSVTGDGGLATSARLSAPPSISVDRSGNLYIPSPSGNKILLVTNSSTPPATPTAAPLFKVAAGTYGSPQTVTISDATPGAAIYVTMDGTSPSTLSQGYNGPIHVTGSVTIKAVALAPGHLTSAPVTAAYTITSPPIAGITTAAGDGTQGLNGANGLATKAEIGSPQGLVVDSTGNLYIADGQEAVVWKVAAKTGVISVVAGNGSRGYSGDGGPATNAQLQSPAGIAVDSAGNLYIADAVANAVRKVAASTGLITTFAGGQSGSSSTIGDGGPATAAHLNHPGGLAIDGTGNVYIADSYNNAVRKVTSSTGIISTFAGGGKTWSDGVAATSTSVWFPSALTFDRSNNLYIAENTGRVRKVAAPTGIITTVAGNGAGGYSGDGGKAKSAAIYAEGLAVDASGNLYLSNWVGAIRKVAANTGIITTIAGNGYFGFSGDGGSATIAELCYPGGIALDAAGNLYIADSGNYRVRKVTFR
jgi:sugar lactone lactonase YvrE